MDDYQTPDKTQTTPQLNTLTNQAQQDKPNLTKIDETPKIQGESTQAQVLPE